MVAPRFHIILKLKRPASLITESNIRWVIPVPAIWNDDARDAMRKSAVKKIQSFVAERSDVLIRLIRTATITCNTMEKKAGIPNKQLILSLEAEAAAVNCLYISPHEKASMDGPGDIRDKFLVVDWEEGGTFDITSCYIKQIYRANGGSHCGRKTNYSFSQLIRDVFHSKDGK